MELLWIALIIAAFAADSCRAAANCHSNACTIKGKTSVLCAYPDPKPAPACGNVISRGLKDSEKKEIVDTVNELRTYVAQGYEVQGNPGPQPGASNMRIMSWDPELAEIAQKWVEQCQFMHAPCVDVDRFEVGQSYVMNYNTGDKMTSNVTSLVRFMYSHVKNMNREKVCNYEKFEARTYLYTTMVWAKSYRIGCGSMVYRNDLTRLTLYCLYAPRGNLVGKSIYQTIHT